MKRKLKKANSGIRRVSVDKHIKPQVGASSVHIVDANGNVQEYNGRAVRLFKAISAIETAQLAQGIESVITYKETAWYAHPIDKKMLLEAFSAYAYHSTACKKIAMYEAGNSYSVIDDATEQEDEEIVAWIDSLGYAGKPFLKTLRKVRTDAHAFGDGLLEIISNEMQEPVALRRVNPIYMFKKTESSGGGWAQIVPISSKDYAIKHFRDYGVPAGEQLGDTEIFQFMLDHPLSDIYGVPPIVDAWNALIKAVFIDEYDQSYFKNSAVPQFAVMLEGAVWQNEDKNNVISFFQNNVKGAANAHRTLVMTTATQGASIKMIPLSQNLPDGGFSMLTETCRSEILTAEGIPPAKAGIIREGALAGSSTEEQLVDFEMTTSFETVDVEMFMNSLIARKTNGRPYTYKVVVSSEIISERQARTDALDINSGARTINQVAKSRGYDTYNYPEADIPLPLLNRQVDMFTEDSEQNTNQKEGTQDEKATSSISTGSSAAV